MRRRQPGRRAGEVAQALAEVGRELAGTLDLIRVGDLIVSTVHRLFGVRRCRLYRRDADSGALICVAEAAEAGRGSGLGGRLPLGVGVAGRAVAEGRAVSVLDWRADPTLELPEWSRQELTERGIGSLTAVPFIADGEVLGALSLGDRRGRVFAARELAVLSAFADQAAVALRNARILAESEQRLHESEALLTVSQALAGTPDFTETMRRLARATARVLHADMAGAYVPSADGTTLQPVAGHRVPPERLAEFRARPLPLKGHAFLVEAWEHQAPVFTADARADPRLDRALAEWVAARSILFVPMIRQADLVGGIIAVWWERAREFAPEELRLADAIGRQAALATENARLYAQAERRRQAAESLAELGRVLSQSLEPQVVGQEIVDRLRALAGARSAGLYRLEPGSGDLVRVATTATVGRARPPELVFPRGVGVMALVIAGGAPVQTPDLLADPRVVLPPDLRARLELAPYRSVLAVPLTVQGRVIGVLVVGDQAGRVFSPEEVQFAEALADQAAIAFENARAYEAARRQRERAEALTEIARDLSGALDRDALLQRVVEYARRLCEADLVTLALVAPDGASAAVVAKTGQRSDVFERVVWARGRGLGGEVLATRTTVTTADRLHDPRWDPDEAARLEGLRAVAAVPMLQGDALCGVLSVCRRTARPFDGSELATVEALARHGAVAIQSASLYGAAVRRGQELDALLRATRTVMGGLDLEATLQRIVAEAAQIAGTPHVKVFLVHRPAGVLRTGVAVGGPVPPGFTVPLGRSYSGRVAVTGRPVFVADTQNDPENLLAARDREHGIRTYLGLPIRFGDEVLGVLTLNTSEPHEYAPEELGYLASFADQAALAIKHAQLYAKAQAAYDELARTQEQLTHSQKMEAVGRLAGGVAHDFNNLLTVIQGRSELLLRRLDAEDPLRRHAKLIAQTAERAAGLTRQLLAFSRKQVLQPRVLDLNEVVGALEKMLRRLIGEDVELLTTLDPHLGRVRADPGQLEQVIMNLAVNARDAMPQGGRLALRTANVELDEATARLHVDARPGCYVLLEVADTGCGMDAATRARIFEPFFTTKGPGKGTGLGLATVFGIVRQSEGHIRVDSEPGRGATFTIHLPRIEPAAGAAAAEATAPRAGGGAETILLVEDEPELRELVVEMLEGAGYTLLTAASGGEALRLVAAHGRPIDLLLTDVIMPEMSGRELAERLRPASPGMKVLFMSGYTDEVISHHGVLTAGAVLLPKPFTPEDLARRLRAVLDAAGG